MLIISFHNHFILRKQMKVVFAAGLNPGDPFNHYIFQYKCFLLSQRILQQLRYPPTPPCVLLSMHSASTEGKYFSCCSAGTGTVRHRVQLHFTALCANPVSSWKKKQRAWQSSDQPTPVLRTFPLSRDSCFLPFTSLPLFFTPEQPAFSPKCILLLASYLWYKPQIYPCCPGSPRRFL